MNIQESVKQKLGNKIKKFYEKNKQRYYIDIGKSEIVPCSKVLFRDLGMRFAIASGVDTPEGIEILYHFSHDKTGKMFTLRVLIEDKNKPEIESIASVTKSSEWIEREIWELLGVNFTGHPGLKHLLLTEDWPEGEYPLRQKEKK
jgi:NADH:ubiquinone oxidoreductase subunit C